MSFSTEEIQDRIELVKPIVAGAFSINGLRRTQEEIAADAVHWELAFRGVATSQLTELKEIGLRHQCTKTAQFLNAWELKVAADWQLAKHRQTVATRNPEPTTTQAVPADYKSFRPGKRKAVGR